jgi:hypothetical protein
MLGKMTYKTYYLMNEDRHMIDIIELYEAYYYLCSQESVRTRDEIVDYWDKLRMGLKSLRYPTTL